MAIQRNDNLQIAAPKPIDSRFGPYSSITEARSSVSLFFRYIGLTVGVIESGTVVEYWWEDGVDDNQLVLKGSSGTVLSNISDGIGNSLNIGSDQNAGAVNLYAESQDSNSDVIVVPKGNGTLKAGGSHSANIGEANDLITFEYAENNYGFDKTNLVFKNADETISGQWTFEQDVTFQGNIIITGQTISVDSQISTADAVIDLNDGEAGSGVTLGYSGLRVDRGTANDFWFGFDESRDFLTAGIITDLADVPTVTKRVALMENNPSADQIALWDGTNEEIKFEDVSTVINVNYDSEPLIPISSATGFTYTTNFKYTGDELFAPDATFTNVRISGSEMSTINGDMTVTANSGSIILNSGISIGTNTLANTGNTLVLNGSTGSITGASASLSNVDVSGNDISTSTGDLNLGSSSGTINIGGDTIIIGGVSMPVNIGEAGQVMTVIGGVVEFADLPTNDQFTFLEEGSGNVFNTASGTGYFEYGSVRLTSGNIAGQNAAMAIGPTVNASGISIDEGVDIATTGAGRVVIDGITMPNTDGIAGQVMTTNGAGVVSFEDIINTAGSHIDITGQTISVIVGTGANEIPVLDASGLIDPSIINAPTVVAAAGDLVTIQDVSDSNNLKTVTVQTIADLAGAVTNSEGSTNAINVADGSGGWSDSGQSLVAGQYLGATTLIGAPRYSFSGSEGLTSTALNELDLVTGGTSAINITNSDVAISRALNLSSNNVIGANSIYIAQKASAAGVISGSGQLWVRNDSPNVIVFTDGSGTDWVLNDPGVTVGGANNRLAYRNAENSISTLSNYRVVSNNLFIGDSGDFGVWTGTQYRNVISHMGGNVVHLGGTADGLNSAELYLQTPFRAEDAGTNTNIEIARFQRSTTSTSADGIGGHITVGVSNDNSEIIPMTINHVLGDVSDGTEDSSLQISGYLAGSVNNLIAVTGFPSGISGIANNSIAIGRGSQSNAEATVVIGPLADAGGIQAISIGDRANPTGGQAIAIGVLTVASATHAIAIGNAAEAEAAGALAIGNNAGDNTGSLGQDSISIGRQTNDGNLGIGAYSTAIGTNLTTSASGAIHLGHDTSGFTDNNTANSLMISFDGSTAFRAGLTIGTVITSNDDPDTNLTITNGALAYDTTDNEFRAVINGAWTSLGGFSGSHSVEDADTSTSIEIANFSRTTSSSAADGIGGYISIGVENSSGTNENLIIEHILADVTNSTEDSLFRIQGQFSGALSEMMAINSGGAITGHGLYSLNIGISSSATGDNSLSVGRLSISSSAQSVAIGMSSNSSADDAIAIGPDSAASQASAVAIGHNSSSSGVNGVAIGNSAQAQADDAVSIGDGAGDSSGTISARVISIGNGANGGSSDAGFDAIAIGNTAQSIGAAAIAIGDGADAQSNDTISIGQSAGNTSGAVGINAISIGKSSNDGTNSIGSSAIAIGADSESSGDHAIILGANTIGSASGAVAIGRNTNATNGGSILIGYHTSALTNSRSDSFALGWDEATPSIWIEGGASKTASTTDATVTTVSTISLDESSTYIVTVDIVGGESDAATEHASYTLKGTFYRNGSGSATQVGSTTVVHSNESTGTMDATLSASGNNVIVQITGIAATNMNWRAVNQLIKVNSN